jgi:phytanoyl-CoA hydroxylase
MIKRGLSVLSSSQINFYQTQGYLVLPKFVEKSAVDELKSQVVKPIEDWNTADYNIFTTNHQSRTTNEYFLESAENISFSLEEQPNEATRCTTWNQSLSD